MNIIHTDDKTIDRQGTFSQDSGLFVASNPFNYTINSELSLIVTGSRSVMGDIQVLDNLSDEIGITHEAIEGEIIENSTNE